ncbi:MAG: hypothetical protein M1816_008283 [Peltula sp. TS41687]|nr:MAG: hypothetical protein M1816_008283 [Peltula sp. TS41687]
MPQPQPPSRQPDWFDRFDWRTYFDLDDLDLRDFDDCWDMCLEDWVRTVAAAWMMMMLDYLTLTLFVCMGKGPTGEVNIATVEYHQWRKIWHYCNDRCWLKVRLRRKGGKLLTASEHAKQQWRQKQQQEQLDDPPTSLGGDGHAGSNAFVDNAVRLGAKALRQVPAPRPLGFGAFEGPLLAY